jgi:nicotinamidase-related amidase
MPKDHGSFPDRAKAALLLIDVINDFEFPDSDRLLEQSIPMTRRLVAFKRLARKNNIPAIYVNDNFGQWKSDFRHIVEHCTDPRVCGAQVSKHLRPQKNDYFVLKPKHSGFYSTSLDVLLGFLRVDTLILAGVATNICVLFTANDAYMRDYFLYVPRDCVAANTADETNHALKQMGNLLKADTRPADEIDVIKLGCERLGSHRR